MTVERCFSVIVKKWRSQLFRPKNACYLSILILIVLFGLNTPQVLNRQYKITQSGVNNSISISECTKTQINAIWAEVSALMFVINYSTYKKSYIQI